MKPNFEKSELLPVIVQNFKNKKNFDAWIYE